MDIVLSILAIFRATKSHGFVLELVIVRNFDIVGAFVLSLGLAQPYSMANENNTVSLSADPLQELRLARNTNLILDLTIRSQIYHLVVLFTAHALTSTMQVTHVGAVSGRNREIWPTNC